MKNKLLITSICCLGVGCIILDVSNLIGIPAFFLVLGMITGIADLCRRLFEWINKNY